MGMDTKLLKQKILDLAIRGKLVPQDPNDEPASVLLERIRAEREKLIAEGKLKRTKTTTDNRHYENVPFEIPDSWKWVKLDDICQIVGRIGFRGYTKNDLVESDGAITLSPSNIVDGRMDYSKCTYISWYKYEESPEIQIHDGDILLVKTGSSFGKCAIVTDLPQKATINPQFVTLKHISINAKLLTFFLQSSYARIKYDSFVLGTAIPTFTQGALGKMLIPLIPHSEQLKILDGINRWFVLIDELEKDKNDLQDAIKQTKSKILDLAIHGKLVEQDPNDEPASELLKQIAPNATLCDNSHYPNLLFEIPDNWVWVKLGDISNYGKCQNVSVEKIGQEEWVLELEDIEKDTARIIQLKTKSDREIKGTRHKFSKGCVLYSKLRTYLNKVLVPDKDGFCTTEIIPINFAANIDSNYMCSVLRSQYFMDYTNQKGYGVKMPRLSTTDAKNGFIPLPPFAEQKRIVKTIEDTFAVLDAIIQEL